MKSKFPFRQVIKDRSDKFTFGKYKDFTVQYVLDEDAGYILWACQEGIIATSRTIYMEAQKQEIDRRFNESMGKLTGMRFWDIYGDDD